MLSYFNFSVVFSYYLKAPFFRKSFLILWAHYPLLSQTLRMSIIDLYDIFYSSLCCLYFFQVLYLCPCVISSPLLESSSNACPLDCYLTLESEVLEVHRLRLGL